MFPDYTKRLAATGLTLALALAGAGCSGGGGAPSVSSSTRQATVHGTVKVKGVTAKKGQVTFNPANIKRKSAPVAVGEIGADGTYTLTTLVGVNNVTVRTPVTVKNPKLQYFTKTFDVQAGDNLYEIDVTP